MSYKLRKFECEHCHNKFERKAKKAKYCSTQCQIAYKNPGLNFHPSQTEIFAQKIFHCEYCKEPFSSRENKRRKYCSHECQLFDLKAKKKITGRKKTCKDYDKVCKTCGDSFTTKSKNRRFCSTLCWYMSDECRRKCSHAVRYNGITFRSSWEAIIAESLDKACFKYEYEKHTFDVGNDIGKYIPDFYIPEKDVFIEVKGQWIGDAKKKVARFKELYSDKRLYVIESVDSLNIFMLLQYLYGLSHFDFDSKDENYIEGRVRYVCMLMIDEIIEVLRETNYKEHKQPKVVDRDHLIEEVVDVFIFVLNLMLLLKVDFKEFKHAFKQKYTLNRFRILFPQIKFKSIATFFEDVNH